MWLVILAFLKKAGWFVVDHWRIFAISFAIGVTVFVVYRSCGPKPAKLNEKEIQESIKAVEEKNDAKLKEILVNADVREKQVDMDVSNTKAETFNARVEARKKYANMNTDDLAKEIEARK